MSIQFRKEFPSFRYEHVGTQYLNGHNGFCEIFGCNNLVHEIVIVKDISSHYEFDYKVCMLHAQKFWRCSTNVLMFQRDYYNE